MREALRIVGRGCGHCERNVGRLVSEEACPETYRCLICKARWILSRREVCVGCRKSISLFGTWGSFGESEPEGLRLEGAAYYWECAEEAMRTVERMA